MDTRETTACTRHICSIKAGEDDREDEYDHDVG